VSKMVIPQSPDELAEILNDAKKLQEIFADKDSVKEFMDSYSRNVTNKDHEFAAQLREQVQMGMAEFLEANGAKHGPPVGVSELGRPQLGGKDYRKVSTGKGAAYNKLAPGARAGMDDIFDSSAEFFQAIWPRMQAVLRNRKELTAKLDTYNDAQTTIRNSFGSEVPADGGFLIPETLRSEILQVALETSIVRPRAQVIPMDSLRVPIPMIDDTSHVSSVFGGIVAYWTEEAASLTESQASFGRIVLDAKKLTGFASVPNELLADATAFGAFFDTVFPRALAFYEDIAFMTGSGVGEPLGFINCPASVNVTKETGQSAATIVWENVTKMYARMLPTALSNAVWICSIDCFPQLATMALSVGTGGSAVWLGNFQNSGDATPPVSILGRPVYFTEKASALGTAGDINFVDLSYYLIGDRQIMQAMSSEHYQFQNDKTAFRVIERLDGRPWLQSAITQQNNSSSTLTPFVQLQTRS
jgi:HK97 family phage major capsid protein